MQPAGKYSWWCREKLQAECTWSATFYYWYFLMNKQLSSLEERIIYIVCLNISSISIMCLVWEFCCCSVAQYCPTLWPHGVHHAQLTYLSLFPIACPNSCPLSRRGHPTISSSVVPFSSCPQSHPASESFPVTWLFTSIYILFFFFLMRTMFKVCIELVTILLPFSVVWP